MAINKNYNDNHLLVIQREEKNFKHCGIIKKKVIYMQVNIEY